MDLRCHVWRRENGRSEGCENKGGEEVDMMRIMDDMIR